MSTTSATTYASTWPDEGGYFGLYGGRYVPETLIAPLLELEQAYATARNDPNFTIPTGCDG